MYPRCSVCLLPCAVYVDAHTPTPSKDTTITTMIQIAKANVIEIGLQKIVKALSGNWYDVVNDECRATLDYSPELVVLVAGGTKV